MKKYLCNKKILLVILMVIVGLAFCLQSVRMNTTQPSNEAIAENESPTEATTSSDELTTSDVSTGESSANPSEEDHTHTFTTKTFSPTTQTAGHDLHTCTSCGFKYADNFTDMLPAEENESESEQVTEESPKEAGSASENSTSEAKPEIRPEEYYGDCPQCGRMIWTSYYPSGCFTYTEDTVCSCGQLVHALECHHH